MNTSHYFSSKAFLLGMQFGFGWAVFYIGPWAFAFRYGKDTNS